jgi:hypothetical protein
LGILGIENRNFFFSFPTGNNYEKKILIFF